MKVYKTLHKRVNFNFELLNFELRKKSRIKYKKNHDQNIIREYLKIFDLTWAARPPPWPSPGSRCPPRSRQRGPRTEGREGGSWGAPSRLFGLAWDRFLWYSAMIQCYDTDSAMIQTVLWYSVMITCGQRSERSAPQVLHWLYFLTSKIGQISQRYPSYCPLDAYEQRKLLWIQIKTFIRRYK